MEGILSGKNVLITGATAGIGKACAFAFAEQGASLILTARRSSLLEKLAEKLVGTTVTTFPLDVRDQKEVMGRISNSRVDILINNAGMTRGVDPLHEMTTEGIDETIDTNVKGFLYVYHAVVQGMLQKKQGHIINIGSIAGHQVYPGGSAYCASKAAVRSLTESMLIDLHTTPIRVCTIDPGIVETDFSKVRFPDDPNRAEQVYQGFTPLSAIDIAAQAVWIATQPPHVQIASMVIFPTDQGSTRDLNKRTS